MLAPVVMIVVTSFFAQEIVSFPPEGWSFHWYSNLWNQREFAGGFLVSFQVAIAAVLIGVPCGTAAALALNRSNIPAKGALSALLLGPLVVPGVVAGTALYLSYPRVETSVDVFVIGTLPGLLYQKIVV